VGPEKVGIENRVTPRETSAPALSAGAVPVRSSMTVPPDLVLSLLGSADENLRALESGLSAEIHVRGNSVTLSGAAAEVALAERVVSELIAIVAGGQSLSPDAVRRSIGMLAGAQNASPAEVLTMDILSRRGRTIRPKTLNQKHYVDAIDANTVVFGIGPAGTGKTYLAMAKAVQALQSKQVNRIILTRPAVEAGERLGFLPGTLSEKIDPYLRPLYDALHDMMDPESIPKLMSAGVIEVAPLAYMRGPSIAASRRMPLTASSATTMVAPQKAPFLGVAGSASEDTKKAQAPPMPASTTSALTRRSGGECCAFIPACAFQAPGLLRRPSPPSAPGRQKPTSPAPTRFARFAHSTSP
jgi:hypothetical protein